MKIAVISFSGNVGKSTVARHLLAPRMNDARIISIESINADDGTQEEAMKGKQFGQLQEELLLMDDAVVDIGASNVEDLIGLMERYKDSHEDYDYFVIPTVPKNKQMRDTISTIDALAELGVPPRKICLVFNMVEIDDDPKQIFPGLFKYHTDAKNFTLRQNAVIHTNEIYEKLKGADQGLMDILNDPTDYKAKIKTTEQPEEKRFYARMVGVKRLAAGVVEELDMCFKALFSGK